MLLEFGDAFGKLITLKMEPTSSWLPYLGKPIEKTTKLDTTIGYYMT